MRKWANVLVLLSILVIIYSLVLKFTGRFVIKLGFVNITPSSGLILAFFLMLFGVFLKLSLRKERISLLGNVNIFFWLGSVITVGICIALLLSHFPASSSKLKDTDVIKRFTEIYFRSAKNSATWTGVPSWQVPLDNWVMQEMIWEVKPDFVIETGTFKGGTALFYAGVLDQISPTAKVITVDIESQISEAAQRPLFKERVEFIQGDSVSPRVIKMIAEKVKGQKSLVLLDSLHTKEHVLKELKLYSQFVSVGSYIVIHDTTFGNEAWPTYGPGPMEAVKDFLKQNPNFTVDHSREKFLLTFSPSGFLKRIK